MIRLHYALIDYNEKKTGGNIMKSIPEMYQEALAKPERLRTEQERAIITAYELRNQAIQKAVEQIPKVEPHIPVRKKSAQEIISEGLAKPERERTEEEKQAIHAIEEIKKAALTSLRR